uniref:Uncharacterized protein n=1 Tax=Nelumbo nucifera TaxID=4432 RepID=A0A822YFR4_NELNU|nr:TPA_asm: hypothetical protein HUJ06_010114 [Nelumbo nucifera]
MNERRGQALLGFQTLSWDATFLTGSLRALGWLGNLPFTLADELAREG